MRAGNSFFALLNITLPENSKEADIFQEELSSEEEVPNVDIARDNEWMQEYQIIYNSYILDDKEATRT